MIFHKSQWMLPLQMLAGAVDKKQLKPILSTLLVRFHDDTILLTATDLEIELTVSFPVEAPVTLPSFTMPARKIFDLMRVLEEGATFDIQLQENHVLIKADSTTFRCFSLPPDTFPLMQEQFSSEALSISREKLIHLLQSTSFAISQQDVRVFLNGMLFEIDKSQLVTVAADGHRMAVMRMPHEHQQASQKLLIPRKSVYELLRLLNAIPDETVALYWDLQLFRVKSEHYCFSSKLIDSQFLPYQQAIPKQSLTFVLVDRDIIKRALMRVMIVMTDKARPAVLEIGEQTLTLLAQNQEQEQVVEQLVATVEGAPIRIGMNPYYLLDVLNVLPEGMVRLSFSTPDKSILIESLGDMHYQYILMPMKLSG